MKLITHKTSPVPALKRGTFAGLMELYERSYVLFQVLLARLENNSDFGWVCIGRCYTLQLQKLEQQRWTTTWLMSINTRVFSDGESEDEKTTVDLVDLKIRVYHDSKQAMVFEPKKPLLEYAETASMRKELLVKYRLSDFLVKILGVLCRRDFNFREGKNESCN